MGYLPESQPFHKHKHKRIVYVSFQLSTSSIYQGELLLDVTTVHVHNCIETWKISFLWDNWMSYRYNSGPHFLTKPLYCLMNNCQLAEMGKLLLKVTCYLLLLPTTKKYLVTVSYIISKNKVTVIILHISYITFENNSAIL